MGGHGESAVGALREEMSSQNEIDCSDPVRQAILLRALMDMEKEKPLPPGLASLKIGLMDELASW